MRSVDRRGIKPRLIMIHAWNGWPERSYLEPDTKFRFGYLHAVREVVEGKWEY